MWKNENLTCCEYTFQFFNVAEWCWWKIHSLDMNTCIGDLGGFLSRVTPMLCRYKKAVCMYKGDQKVCGSH